MMRKLLIPLLVLGLSLIGYAFALTRVSPERNALRQEQGIGTVVPSPVARIIALEFKGLFADVIFSRAMTYYGRKIMKNEHLTSEEWDWLFKSMMAATDLDPYFFDPYYFGAMNLAWEARRVTEANALLEKAFRCRHWDWNFPFYLGFNYFYFLNDSEKASYYLLEAAKRPGGSRGLVPTLAARFAQKAGRTEIAVLYLDMFVYVF